MDERGMRLRRNYPTANARLESDDAVSNRIHVPYEVTEGAGSWMKAMHPILKFIRKLLKIQV